MSQELLKGPSQKVFTEPAVKICSQILPPLLDKTEQKIILIGIDGPTAAGKTIFADTMAEWIRSAYGRPCWTYRLDWTLAQRAQRVGDLANLTERDVSFPLEGELHMHLGDVETFLKTVHVFNERQETQEGKAPEKVILENLYSRQDGGNLTGREECTLEPGLVILLEGHYTLRTGLNNLIDLNVLLLGDGPELLSRKIARVKEYRRAHEAEDYFGRVDMPSFRHHLERFGSNADVVIDNTDYKNPQIKEPQFVHHWLLATARKEDAAPVPAEIPDFAGLVQRVLSASLLVDEDLRAALLAALVLILKWDRCVGEYLRVSIDNIKGDLTAISQKLVKILNERFADKSCRFEITHTNTLYNVYHRSLPIAIGIRISGPQSLNILVDVFHDFMRLHLSWSGGCTWFHIERELGAISKKDQYRIKEIPFHPAALYQDQPMLRVITPTSFTIPRFLRDFECEEIFSGHEAENISPSQALIELADKGEVWIHRFAKFVELNFFHDIVENMGGTAVKAGNYLIATLSKNADLNKKFTAFRNQLSKRISDFEDNRQDEAHLDRIIDAEREEICRFVETHCPDFVMLDGYLHCSKISHDPQAWRRIIDQIAAMLNSPYRLLRKRAVQFIQRYFPELSLEVNKLWDDVPPGAKTHISLDALTFISPSILAEIYLWLALRDDHSAVLGANIYDIRKNSADCMAYLKAASGMETPIVLQGSLNALGQKEDDDGVVRHGYLQPQAGVHDFIQAALLAARDLLLVSGKTPPLFGIGLDHVDAANDRPEGRARRFLQAAMSTECVTHYVLDGSARFCARDHSRPELKDSFAKVTEFEVNLLDGKEHYYIFDKEVCAGELNYFQGAKKAMIPAPSDMELFARIFQHAVRKAGLGAFNTRPTLFIGNLGTTHHGFDEGDVCVEYARLWRDRIKRDNFVSAVLHGTTNTHPFVLSQATAGCHKINVAGDFLNTLMKAAPERIQRRLIASAKEPKRAIPLVRPDMDCMSSSEAKHLEQSLQAHCRSVLDNINAPRLSSLDVDYFRYKNYKFTGRQVQVICEEILRHIEGYSLMELEKSADPRTGHEFAASLIEVPFDEEYKTLIRVLWEEGVRYFHIDAGDGKFVPREFAGLEKAAYLRQTFPQAMIHCHLMVENPHFPNEEKPSPIEQYVKAGCNAVAVHQRAFRKAKFLSSAVQLIRKCGARPGLIIETTQALDTDLSDLIRDLGLDWVVIMGVPVGYGGQIFDMTTLKRIQAFYQFAISQNQPFLIEIDGGLTLENLLLCRKSGAQVFSGWSIIKADFIEDVRAKVRQVRKIVA